MPIYIPFGIQCHICQLLDNQMLKLGSEKSTRYIQECLGSPDRLEHKICKRIRKKLYIFKARQRKDMERIQTLSSGQRKTLKTTGCIRTFISDSGCFTMATKI